MRIITGVVLVASTVALGAATASAAVVPIPVVDPCVFGYPADHTVLADGRPAPEQPCVLAVRAWGN